MKKIGVYIMVFVFLAFGVSNVYAADWVMTKEISNISNPVTAIDKFDDYIMSVGDNGEILYSSNGGNSWTESVPFPSSMHDVAVFNNASAITVGENGLIYKTTNFGSSWINISSGTTDNLNSIYMNGGNGWIVGDNGAVLYTVDGGDSWTLKTLAVTEDFNAIIFLDSDSSYGWIVGDNGTVMSTHDGGVIWASWGSSVVGTSENLYGVYFQTATKGWIVGRNGVVISEDRTNISLLSIADSSSLLIDIYFSDNSNGYIIGQNGFIITDDGGDTWTAQGGYSDRFIFDMVESDNGYLYAPLLDVSNSVTGIYLYDEIAPSAVTNLTVDKTPTGDSDVTFSWTASTDAESSIDYYMASIDGDTYVSIGNVTEYNKLFAEGVHSFVIKAVDEAGNISSSTSASVAVDLSGPSVSAVMPISTTIDITTSLYVDTGDDVAGVDHCLLYLNGASLGLMTDYSDGTFRYDYDFSVTGSYSAYAVCYDTLSNATIGNTSTITVGETSSSTADTTAPTVSSITPTSVTEDAEVGYSVTASDASGIDTCNFYADDSYIGVMFESSGTYAINYTFTDSGSHTAYAKCIDIYGNYAFGNTSTITVGGTSSGSVSDESSFGVITSLSDVAGDTLVKMQCINSTLVNDPCRAVYYYDGEGIRHAFPNAKIYFTWYTSFDDVQLVSDDVIGGMPFGKNVTYHPGSKMVKFQTSNTVYVVEQGGLLRPIASEEIAQGLYGDDWNTKIDDISDAFFGNYHFGTGITAISGFDKEAVTNSVSSISQNF